MLRNLNQDHPITRRMDTVVAPFTGSIEMAGTDGLAGVEATLLAATSREATVGATVTSLDPLEQAERQPSEQPGPHAVLVALSGALPSGWAGRSAPDGTGLPPLEVAPEGTRLLVGMSFEMPLANPGLLLAGVDWMAADEDLLSIRPRLSAPPLLVRPDNVRWVRAANVIGVPLLVSVFGFLRLRGRRRRGAAR